MDGMIKIETPGGATYAPDFAAVASLSKKLADLAGQLGPVSKDGTNLHFKYKFVSYEQVAAMIRVRLAQAGLSLSVGQGTRAQENNTVVLLTEAVFTDNDTGAMRLVRWYGEGQDTQDKGTAKALTSAVKYGLMRMFLLSDQEDVDPDSDAPTEQKQAATTAKSNPAPARPLAAKNEEPPHWIEDGATRSKFWAWTNAQGLSNDEVHKALGVESVKVYAGSKEQAAEVIRQWIAAQAEKAEA